MQKQLKLPPVHYSSVYPACFGFYSIENSANPNLNNSIDHILTPGNPIHPDVIHVLICTPSLC